MICRPLRTITSSSEKRRLRVVWLLFAIEQRACWFARQDVLPSTHSQSSNRRAAAQAPHPAYLLPEFHLHQYKQFESEKNILYRHSRKFSCPCSGQHGAGSMPRCVSPVQL